MFRLCYCKSNFKKKMQDVDDSNNLFRHRIYNRYVIARYKRLIRTITSSHGYRERRNLYYAEFTELQKHTPSSPTSFLCYTTFTYGGTHANKVVEGGGEASGAGEDLVVREALEALVALVAPVAVVAQKDRMVVVAALVALVGAAHKDRMVAEDACGVSCS
ncbi:unnamed protein product, partial [Vitis vinifera]